MLKKGSISTKLLGIVAVSVMVAFVLCGVLSSVYFYDVLKNQAVDAEVQKLSQTARQLRYIQDEVESLAKAISVNERLQSTLLEDHAGDVFDTLAANLNITDMLSGHLNMKDYFYSAYIIARDGRTFSSNLYQGEIDLAQAGWYNAFKETHAHSGFTVAHSIYVAQKSSTLEVISYVMDFRDLRSGQTILGDIVINVDFAQIARNAQVDMALLRGYALVGRDGGVILQEGEVALEEVPGEVPAGTSVATLAGGNILITDGGMMDGWYLVGEISSDLLMQKLQYVWIFFVVMYIAVMGVLILVLYHAILTITRPINQLAELTERVGAGDFSVRAHIDTGDELAALGERFNAMTRDLENYLQRSIEYEQTTRKMELNRLMLQINPHFIYNTLNSIVYMAQAQGNEDVVAFSKAFISLLQDTLTVDADGFFTTLGQEVQNVKNYLLLQSYRYPALFTEEYHIDPEVENCRVPSVLLQPLAENAVFHGLYSKPEGGRITISAARKGDEVHICVADNGVGMDADTIARLMGEDVPISGMMRTIGVSNVKKRVEHSYPGGYGIRIDSRLGEGTTITINIPYAPAEGPAPAGGEAIQEEAGHES